MEAFAVVFFGALATWVAMGGGSARRLRRTRPARRRIGPSARSVMLASSAAFAVSVAAAVVGPVGGLVTAGACTALWIRARRVRARPDRLPVTGDLPVVIGLLAAGVRSGSTVQGCLPPVARAVGGRLGAELSAVAERLRLGADPERAWRRSALPAPLAAVGRDLARAADTGAPVADLLDRHVTDLRRVLRARATARVERLGVLVVAPLGLCFLPAFVLIGIVPMAADLLAQALR